MQKIGWPQIRKFFNDIHLWLGLSSGLIVVAVCFSGTVYVWNTELTEASASQLYKVKTESEGRTIEVDSLAQKIRDTSGGIITSIVIPASAGRTYQFTAKKEGDNGRGVTWFVNPYTGEVTGTSNENSRTKKFMATMFSLHRWLCLDRVGKKELGSAIVGWATIIFTLGCITGLIIWFPKRMRDWKRGLKIKWNANWKRKNHDLHNSLAFYSLFILLLMGLTGPFFSFTWYRKAIQETLGTYKPQVPPKPAQAGEQKLISIKEYVRVADSALNYKGDYTINLTGGDVISVSKNKRGFFAPAAADRLTLDALTGKVKKKEIFRDKPFNERISGSIKALHTGNVYGTFTKILYFIACLIATSLPITGTLIWWNKLRKKRSLPPIV